jgi:hypothetical protein
MLDLFEDAGFTVTYLHTDFHAKEPENPDCFRGAYSFSVALKSDWVTNPLRDYLDDAKALDKALGLLLKNGYQVFDVRINKSIAARYGGTIYFETAPGEAAKPEVS